MIKAIVFDFGDVFINLNKNAVVRELKKFNVDEFSDELRENNHKYEKGLISSEEFLSGYQQANPEFSKEEIKRSWNTILTDFPRYRLDFIKRLSEKKEYKLILLSNTNEIHINWIKEHVPFFEEFRKCFDAFYLSYEINMRKPDAEIYRFVLEEHGLKAEECLFIDDTAANTQAAEELGFHTWNLEPTREDVIDLFTTKGELF